MKLKIRKLIKIISTIAIAIALGLEAWNLSLQMISESLPANLNSLFWLGTIMLIAHGIEGLIGAIKANLLDRNSLKYGIYIFFVGFIGLQELFEITTE